MGRSRLAGSGAHLSELFVGLLHVVLVSVGVPLPAGRKGGREAVRRPLRRAVSVLRRGQTTPQRPRVTGDQPPVPTLQDIIYNLYSVHTAHETSRCRCNREVFAPSHSKHPHRQTVVCCGVEGRALLTAPGDGTLSLWSPRRRRGRCPRRHKVPFLGLHALSPAPRSTAAVLLPWPRRVRLSASVPPRCGRGGPKGSPRFVSRGAAAEKQKSLSPACVATAGAGPSPQRLLRCLPGDRYSGEARVRTGKSGQAGD